MTSSDKPNKGIGAGKFLRFSLIYALGDLLTKGAQIVLLPFYISVLTQSEVGTLAVLTTLTLAMWHLTSLGLGFAIRRFYHDQPDQQQDQFVFTLWVARILAGLPILTMAIVVTWLGHSSTGTSIPLNLIWMALLTGFLRGGLNLIEAWMVIREQPVHYRTFTFLQFLSTTALIIYLITVVDLGVTGAILGELISLAAWTLISAVLLLRRSIPQLASVHWKDIITYCMPTLPHVFFMWGLSVIDRIMLDLHSVPLSDIGVYDTGYKLASFLSIVIMSMRAAWLPNYFKTARDEGANAKYVKMAMLFTSIVFFAGLAGVLFAPEGISLISVFAKGQYGAAMPVFRIVVIGQMAFGFFVICNQPLFYDRKVLAIAAASGIGLAVNVLANLLLIPQLGIMGSAWSTLISYLTIAGVMFLIVTKTHQFQWPLHQLLYTTLLVVFLGGVGCLLPMNLWGWSLVIKSALLIAFPLLLIFEIRVSRNLSCSIRPRFKLSYGKPLH